MPARLPHLRADRDVWTVESAIQFQNSPTMANFQLTTY
jgi:hypothetical protein